MDLVVIHCTELPDLATAREYGECVLHASGTGNSGHYYVDRDGAIYRYVPGTRVANHVRGHNANSIGIELVNLGRYPHWWDSRHQQMTESYPAPQIAALRALLAHLRTAFSQLAIHRRPRRSGHGVGRCQRRSGADSPAQARPRMPVSVGGSAG